MDIIAPELTDDERERAQLVWEYLFTSTTWAQSVIGNQMLQDSPQSVQAAVAHFIALALREKSEPRDMPNPFLSKSPPQS